MDKLEIVLESENNKGTVKFLHNGQIITHVFELNLHFNARKGEFSFTGKKFSTDKMGQFYVDPETKDTAMEDCNLLDLFNPAIQHRELVNDYQKAIEFGLWNIYQTSLLNARNFIKERNCELRKAV